MADTAFASGDAGVHFELMAKPARDVMKTHLVIDGQQLEYFNQKERWQRFSWPDEQWQPGASLSWTSTQNMERIPADFREAGALFVAGTGAGHISLTAAALCCSGKR